MERKKSQSLSKPDKSATADEASLFTKAAATGSSPRVEQDSEELDMKLHQAIIAATALLALPGCEEKTVTEKAKDKVDDALDRRPGEKVRDAAEDVKDAAKDAAKEAKDATKKGP